MHILHVETGRHLYGGAAQVLNLIPGLGRHAVRGTLICTRDSALAIAARARGIDVVPVPMAGDLDVGFVGRLRRLIRELDPSLVHVHSRRGADLFGGPAALLAGKPAVLSRRVDSPGSRLGRPKYWFYRRIVAISGCIHRQLRDSGVPERKLRTVPSGVLPEACAPNWSRQKFLSEFDLADDDFVIAVTAQLIPRKGHRYLIEALPGIRAAFAGTRVLFFGAGTEEQRLRDAVARQGQSDVVCFAGYRTDLLDFLGHVQLVVHPAIREGLGLSLLEAQAAGVPVVGFRSGGQTEAVDDGVTGTLVPPLDTGALADAIAHLIYHPRVRTRMGNAAREWIRDRFSLEQMVAGNLSVYNEVLGQSEESRSDRSR
ncbi:MAG: glycosyltransferase family 1 protein [Gammaproteobacteria bacterium]|nr:MAG: glycosyltransferase family 1 protein [Gammaproteobacteria bacterium]